LQSREKIVRQKQPLPAHTISGETCNETKKWQAVSNLNCFPVVLTALLTQKRTPNSKAAEIKDQARQLLGKGASEQQVSSLN